MKICGISDLHGCVNLDELFIKECDILCIAGDIMPLDIQRNIPESLAWIKDIFIPWAEKQPIDKIFLVAGNHDSVAYKERTFKSLFTGTKIIYLEDSGYSYISKDGSVYNIYGTPWCSMFGNWYFMLDDENLIKKFSNIPNDCDILITHNPPDLLKVGTIQEGYNFGEDAGCIPLADEIIKKTPKLVICGHIHTGDHNLTYYEVNNKKIGLVNVSLLNERYYNAFKPFYAEFKKDSIKCFKNFEISN